MSSCFAVEYRAMFLRYELTQPGDGHLRLVSAQAVVVGEHHEAGGEPRNVPLEGARERLVEVTEIECKVSLRCRPEAEVQNMSIAAELYLEPGVRSCGEISGHDRGRTSEERPWRRGHAPESNRHEFRQTHRVLCGERLDGIGGTERGVPGRERYVSVRARVRWPIA